MKTFFCPSGKASGWALRNISAAGNKFPSRISILPKDNKSAGSKQYSHNKQYS